MKCGTVKDADGRNVGFSHGKYIVMMQSPDREVRKIPMKLITSLIKMVNNRGDVFLQRKKRTCLRTGEKLLKRTRKNRCFPTSARCALR